MTTSTLTPEAKTENFLLTPDLIVQDEPVESQPTSTDLVEMLNAWNLGQVAPKDYSQRFLDSLPQAQEAYNTEDLNEMFEAWQKESINYEFEIEPESESSGIQDNYGRRKNEDDLSPLASKVWKIICDSVAMGVVSSADLFKKTRAAGIKDADTGLALGELSGALLIEFKEDRGSFICLYDPCSDFVPLVRILSDGRKSDFELTTEDDEPSIEESETAKLKAKFSEAAYRVILCFFEICTVVRVPVLKLFRRCLAAGLTIPEVKAGIAELVAREAFLNYCNNTGQYYLECGNAFESQAQVFSDIMEALDSVSGVINSELSAVNKPDDKDFTSLSHHMRSQGIELNSPESVLINAGQTLSQSFRRHQPIHFKTLARIMNSFCQQELEDTGLTPREIADGLVKKGVCTLDKGILTLVDIPKKARQKPFLEMKFEPMGKNFLACCDRCVGVGFLNGNLVQRSAVKALMQARFEVTAGEFSLLAKGLISRGVIEKVDSKGAVAFRLAPDAIGVVKAW